MRYVRHLLTSKGPATAWRRLRAMLRQVGPTERVMARTLQAYVDLVTAFGARPTFPTPAVVAARHPRLIRRLHERGVEIAVHGDQHVDMALLAPAAQADHVRRAVQRFRRIGVPVVGFRAPYLRWNASLLDALRGTFAYDSSLAVYWEVAPLPPATAARVQRVLDFYRAQRVADGPVLPVVENGLVRLPVSLPDDEILVDRLEWRDPAAIAEVWGEMLRRTHAQGGLFVLQLHPERFAHCAEALRTVLRQAQAMAPSVWLATLREVTAWWRARSAARWDVRSLGEDVWEVTLQAPQEAVLLVRTRAPQPDWVPWVDGWYRVPTHHVVLRTPHRPTVGVTRDVPRGLVDAVRQAGFPVEPATSQHGLVIAESDGSRAGLERVWHHLRATEIPLVRVSPWPEGAACALCVTGDLDAVTWWDFLDRVRGR